jgi:hypothetical protein
MTIEAFPLAWPTGWARTPAHKRERSKYSVTIGRARDEALATVRAMGGRQPVITTNVQTRRDGLFYANAPEPQDPGVAIYWNDAKNRPRVIACDAWRTLRDNMRAIGLTLEALRQLERTHCTQILERAYQGFAALPADTNAARPKRTWWDVLGLSVTRFRRNGPTAPDGILRDDIETAYRQLARERHPDAGGSNEQMAELNQARVEALKECGL